MKRLLAILTLAFILTNVAGFYVYFVFRLKEIRKEMRAALKDYPTEKLQRITLTKTEYDEAKNDEGEIEWSDFRYDIARVQIIKDQVIVLALRDEAETSLLAFMQRIVDMTSSDNQSPPSVLTSYLSLVFTVPDYRLGTVQLCELVAVFGEFPSEFFFSPALGILSPPPRG